MEPKIKFSDIIRYILLGGIAATVFLFFIGAVTDIDFMQYYSVFSGHLTDGKIPEIIIVIALIAVFYIIGIMQQGCRLGVVQAVNNCRKVKFINDALEAMAHSGNPLYKLSRTLLLPSYFYYYENYCRVLKFKQDKKGLYPSWIYISDHPESLAGVIAAYLSNSEEDDKESDGRYLNELLTALLIPIRILAITAFAISLFQVASPEFSDIRWAELGAARFFLVSGSLSIVILWLARAYAIEYIKELGHRCEAAEEKNARGAVRLYSAKGAPSVYVLIRTTLKGGRDAGKYLEEALESVRMQTYGKIHIIILEDRDETDASDNAGIIPDTILKFKHRCASDKTFSSLYNRITYSHASCGGAAGSVYQIKKAFLKASKPGDICMMLDDDDILRREDAVEDIVEQMTKGNADICLTSFESQNNVGIDITNHGGKDHNEIVMQLSEHPSRFNSVSLCHASSIGWTKCLSHRVIEKYFEIFKPVREEFKALQSYEDFPDFILMMLKGCILTGAAEPVHSYIKRNDSITGSPNIRAFRIQRTGFLALLLRVTIDNEKMLCPKAWEYTCAFVIFKITQIENILAKYRINAKDDPAYGIFKDIQALQFTEWMAKTLEKDTKNHKTIDRLIQTYPIQNGKGIADRNSLFVLLASAVCKEIQENNKKTDVFDIAGCMKDPGYTNDLDRYGIRTVFENAISNVNIQDNA